MPARLPDFLGLGTQKGGTTSLHNWLEAHHDVYVPKCKEIHYFDTNYDKPTNWYTDHFSSAKNNQICGEITPFYLFHPEVPSRIKTLVPAIKMIVLLRDPVERAISQMLHSRKRGFELLKPQEAFAAEHSRMKTGGIYSLQKHSYISRSKYLEQMDRYESIFDRKQILVIKSEELFSENSTSLDQIRKFLGLNILKGMDKIKKSNEGTNYMAIEKKLKEKLQEELESTAKGIRERYGFGWDW